MGYVPRRLRMSTLLDAARSIAPQIRAAADRIEHDRRVPLELVRALTEAGVFRMCVPRTCGGSEVEPATMIGVLEAIAEADGSAGWSAMIGATSGVAAAYLPADRHARLAAHAVPGQRRAHHRYVDRLRPPRHGEPRHRGGRPLRARGPVALIDHRPAPRARPAVRVPRLRPPRARHRRGGARDRPPCDRRAHPPRRGEDSDRQPPAARRAARRPGAGGRGRGRARVGARVNVRDRGGGVAGGKGGRDTRRPSTRASPAGCDACDAGRRACRRSRVSRGRWHRSLRHEPAPAAVPGHPRRDATHDGGARDARGGGKDPPRTRRRHLHAMTADDFATLRFERVGQVLRVTIDHPSSPLNAVDDRLHQDLTALFAGLKRENEARAILLTGRGRAFSAGGDFAWLPALQEPGRLEALRRDAKQLIWDLLDVEVPIVAAVDGHAIGLRGAIALLCDVIFMADTATIGDPHVKVGIVAGDGGAAIWPLAVGPARAKEYLLTGDALTAAEAERIGLVNHVVPAAELDAAAMAFATRLAAGAPLAVRYTKLAVNKLVKDALNVAFDTSTALELLTFHSEDHQEALAALREKRPPVFKGR